MKFSSVTIALALLASQCSAFVSQPSIGLARNHVVALNAVELEPEPEGGEELTSLKTMDGSRMKNMGEVQGVKDDDGTVYKFWLTATAKGDLIKELNTKVLKDAAKKANFPGFRKVRRESRYFFFNFPPFHSDNLYFQTNFRDKFHRTPCHRFEGLLFRRVLSKRLNQL